MELCGSDVEDTKHTNHELIKWKTYMEVGEEARVNEEVRESTLSRP